MSSANPRTPACNGGHAAVALPVWLITIVLWRSEYSLSHPPKANSCNFWKAGDLMLSWCRASVMYVRALAMRTCLAPKCGSMFGSVPTEVFLPSATDAPNQGLQSWQQLLGIDLF
eukprot:732800-Pelagomonas_calceolata.AAC.1